MNPMFKVMQAKKKRAVDPLAPPRPNLLSHEKVLKDTKITMEQQADTIRRLERRLEDLEARLARQTDYLTACLLYTSDAADE